MKKIILVSFSFALVLAFTLPALAGDATPCKFMQLEPDRRGWARFQCPDCSVVTVKQGPWSQRHVAKSVCAQVGPGTSAKVIAPNNCNQNQPYLSFFFRSSQPLHPVGLCIFWPTGPLNLPCFLRFLSSDIRMSGPPGHRWQISQTLPKTCSFSIFIS